MSTVQSVLLVRSVWCGKGREKREREEEGGVELIIWSGAWVVRRRGGLQLERETANHWYTLTGRRYSRQETMPKSPTKVSQFRVSPKAVERLYGGVINLGGKNTHHILSSQNYPSNILAQDSNSAVDFLYTFRSQQRAP